MSYAVAAGHALTTDAAADVLAAGGSATDAVIAGAAVAFVAEPVLAGPLGGGYLLLAPIDGPPTLLDGFVETPGRRGVGAEIAEIEVDFGTATQRFHIGPGSVAVPCLMPALAEAHARHGRMPLRELMAPAAAAARSGVTVTPFQAHLARVVAPILGASDAARALHFAGDAPLPAGERLANPALADVLEVFGHEGGRFFAEGEIAAALAALPGVSLSRGDLTACRPEWRTPLAFGAGAWRAAANPRPSRGGVMVARILDRPTPDLVAFAARLDHVTALRRNRALEAPRGTTHISVIDAAGNGAALSLSNGEGCGEILPGTGIMPNNMLGEAELLPDGPDAWEPATRMASLMCPLLLERGDGTRVLMGSGGSERIPSAIARVARAVIEDDLDAETAVALPRLHPAKDRLEFEDQLPEDARAALLRAWPEARPWPAPDLYFGGVHMVRRDRAGAVSAAGDPRREGAARLGSAS